MPQARSAGQNCAPHTARSRVSPPQPPYGSGRSGACLLSLAGLPIRTLVVGGTRDPSTSLAPVGLGTGRPV
eukprot:9841611-Lingulodinium_polyedra.AAC.1